MQRALRRMAVALAALAVAACGGGGSGGDAVDAVTQGTVTLAPATPVPVAIVVNDSLVMPAASDGPEAAQRKRQAAARFLHQATFGATEAEVARLQELGFDGWLDVQFAQAATVTSAATLAAGDARLAAGGDFGQARASAHAARRDRVWQAFVAGEDQLRQRIAWALSQVFVVSSASSTVAQRPVGLADYHDMLVRNAFGTYRRLLEDVALHPVMGVYLSHARNKREDAATGRVPDENFAREVMQLFSIGLVDLDAGGWPRIEAGRSRETYTNDDVTGLARVFTGWSWGGPDTSTANFEANRYYFQARRDLAAETQPMKQYAAFHSPAEKRFLGTVIPAGTDGVSSLRIALDALANHPNTGPFIARQLIQRLVTSNPGAEYVARVAAVFANDGRGARGNLAAVVRAILLDPEARNDAAARASTDSGKLREPVLRMTNWARAFEVAATNPEAWESIIALTEVTQQTGQLPWQSPSVFNFYRPGYTPPGSDIAAAGQVAPEFQITTEVTTAGYSNLVASRVMRTPTASAVGSTYAKEVALAVIPEQLVDRINTLLVGGAMTLSTWNRIVAEVNGLPANTAAQRLRRVHVAVLLAMHSPEYLVQR